MLGSIASIRGAPNTPFYAASKAALRNLGASLSGPLAKRGIRVNVIAPGLIDTPLTEALNEKLATRAGTTVAGISGDRIAQIPAGRMGTTSEVADLCAVLLSREAAYVSGSTVFATGGVLAGTI